MKKTLVPMLMLVTALFLGGCSNKALDAANEAVNAYNAEVATYNESIVPYNTAAQKVAAHNQELQDAVDAAQEVLNKGETPFDEATTAALKDAMTAALDAKVTAPEELAPYSDLTVDEKAKKDDLEALTEQANAAIKAMKEFTVPDIPEIPDYTEEIKLVADAQLAYEDSVRGMKQITAPTDDFILERLQRVDTITAMEAVSENRDPNGLLNKQGGYIGCIYFRDIQVDWSNIYIEPGMDSVIDVGCSGGGAIEIFKTVEEAQVRDAYLGSFDGTMFSSGSHYVYGTIVIRTSNELSGTKQLELTDKIVQALVHIE